MRSFLSFSCSLRLLALVLHATPAAAQSHIRVVPESFVRAINDAALDSGNVCAAGVRAADTLILSAVTRSSAKCGWGAVTRKDPRQAPVPLPVPCAPSLRELLEFRMSGDLLRVFVCPGIAYALVARPDVVLVPVDSPPAGAHPGITQPRSSTMITRRIGVLAAVLALAFIGETSAREAGPPAEPPVVESPQLVFAPDASAVAYTIATAVAPAIEARAQLLAAFHVEATAPAAAASTTSHVDALSMTINDAFRHRQPSPIERGLFAMPSPLLRSTASAAAALGHLT